MQDLNDYFTSVSTDSNFQCNLGELGGFINFTNSGQRGLKEFTLSLKTILAGLQDMVNNINIFADHSSYVEKEWRDLSTHFTDLILRSMITVQTKPCFTTFSKVINWANDVEISEYNDNHINLEINSLNNAITKVKELSYSFTPTITNQTSLSKTDFSSQNKAVISEKSIGKFVFSLTQFLINNQLETPLFSNLIEKDTNTKAYNLEHNGHRLTSIFRISEQPIGEDNLKRGDTLRFFPEPLVVGTDLYYLSNQWTDGAGSRLDIQTLISIFNGLYNNYKIIKKNELYLLIQHQDRLLPKHTTTLSKPFLLLAGISGTGKTRFVREQAKATGSISENYRLTAVRPDWHEPSDILGYISRLNGVEYVTTQVLQFIARAWRAIIDAQLDLNDNNTESKLTVTGDKAQLNTVLPYWLCLDEMNLAPVEQYFADYLSILETREWHWDDEQFEYCCDALLTAATIQQLDGKANTELRKSLGFEDEHYNDTWALFCEHGLGIPFNLVVAGTVNMDETTHGFSRKVIDRALSFDFGEFFPNNFDHFFTPTVKTNALSYPIHSHATTQYLRAFDSDGTKSIHFLKAVNTVLNDTPFKLAFRALNELLLAVMSTQPTDQGELQAVWDDFLMHKVLPRIEGDYDKLALINKATSSNEQSLLTELAKVLQQELTDIWSTTDNPDKRRPDLYRKNEEDSALYITCRSKSKLAWMQQRLERSGFTSFWP